MEKSGHGPHTLILFLFEPNPIVKKPENISFRFAVSIPSFQADTKRFKMLSLKLNDFGVGI